MVDTLDLNKNTAKLPKDNLEDRDRGSDAVHRHAEQEAMNAATRSGERMNKNEAGNDIINK